jgi:hypothetical protein
MPRTQTLAKPQKVDDSQNHDIPGPPLGLLRLAFTSPQQAPYTRNPALVCFLLLEHLRLGDYGKWSSILAYILEAGKSFGLLARPRSCFNSGERQKDKWAHVKEKRGLSPRGSPPIPSRQVQIHSRGLCGCGSAAATPSSWLSNFTTSFRSDKPYLNCSRLWG